MTKMVTKKEYIPVGCVPSAAVAVCWGCLPVGCLPRGVSAQGVSDWGGVYPSACWDTPPMDKILDTRLWKHYLSATSFADSNYVPHLPMLDNYRTTTRTLTKRSSPPRQCSIITSDYLQVCVRLAHSADIQPAGWFQRHLRRTPLWRVVWTTVLFWTSDTRNSSEERHSVVQLDETIPGRWGWPCAGQCFLHLWQKQRFIDHANVIVNRSFFEI